MTGSRSRFLTYFCWLVFAGTIFILSEVLRNAETIRGLHVYWLDVAASYALLGALGVIAAVIGAGLLVGLDGLALRLKLRWLQILSQSIVFACFVAVWLNVARIMLTANGLKLDTVLVFYQLVTFFAAGLVSYWIFNRALANWMVVTGTSLRPFVGVTVVLFMVLTAYSCLQPLSKGKPAPVTLTDPGRKSPNIILIVLDSLTTHDMSLYGYHLPTTPNLDRIARTWTIYEQANSAATGTLTFMPSVLTGRYAYSDDGYRYGEWARTGEGWMNLAQALSSTGYETVYVRGQGFPVGFYHLQTGWDRVLGDGQILGSRLAGANLDILPGFLEVFLGSIRAHYLTFTTNASSSGVEALLSSTSEPVYEQAEQYFRMRASQVAATKPFFAYLHFSRPHNPYAGAEFAGKFLPVEDGLNSDLPVDKLRLRYDENILKADQQVAHLIGVLQETGLYDQSLIIITADHGTNFEGSWSGGYYTPYLAAAEHSIPLIVKYPAQVNGQREQKLVNTLDITPTILDVAGVSYPQAWLEGRSLLEPEASQRVIYVSLPAGLPGKSTIAAISGQMKLVQRGPGSLLSRFKNTGNVERLLFDLVQDPKEQNNLIDHVDHTDLSAALDLYEERMASVAASGNLTTAPCLVATLSPIPCSGK